MMVVCHFCLSLLVLMHWQNTLVLPRACADMWYIVRPSLKHASRTMHSLCESAHLWFGSVFFPAPWPRLAWLFAALRRFCCLSPPPGPGWLGFSLLCGVFVALCCLGWPGGPTCLTWWSLDLLAFSAPFPHGLFAHGLCSGHVSYPSAECICFAASLFF